MNFKKWFKKSFNAKFGSSIQDEALELGWYACRKEVLDILESNTREYESAHGTGWEYVDIDVIKEIEKL